MTISEKKPADRRVVTSKNYADLQPKQLAWAAADIFSASLRVHRGCRVQNHTR